jgi:hypothetical protein
LIAAWIDMPAAPRCRSLQIDRARRERVEARDAVERDQVLRVGAGDGEVVDRHIAGRIEWTYVGEVAGVLDAAHLYRLLRSSARRADVDVADGQILIVSEQQDVAAAVRTGGRDGVVAELAVEDRHRADGVAVGRTRSVAGADIGEAVELGVRDRHIVESHRARKAGGTGRDQDAIGFAGGIDIEIGDGERAVEGAGNGDLAVEVYRATALVAVDGDPLVGDGHVFGVGPRRDADRSAVCGRGDCGLNRGEGACLAQ